MEVNPDGMSKVLYRDMLKKGFDFGYFTSILKTSKRNYCFFYTRWVICRCDDNGIIRV
jgi:hypothetical protein